MNAHNRVWIFDTTLRDGEQSPGCSMTVPEKLKMAAKLVDLGVDILRCHCDSLPTAALRDDLPVDHRLQDRIAVAAEAFGSQLRVPDFRTVDHRHHTVRGSGGGSPLGVGGCGRRLGVGLRRARKPTPDKADANHKHAGGDLTAQPARLPVRPSRAILA